MSDDKYQYIFVSYEEDDPVILGIIEAPGDISEKELWENILMEEPGLEYIPHDHTIIYKAKPIE